MMLFYHYFVFLVSHIMLTCFNVQKTHYFSNTVHYCRSTMLRLSQTSFFTKSLLPTSAVCSDWPTEKFRSAKTQSAALKQFMPRRTRDHFTPSSSFSNARSSIKSVTATPRGLVCRTSSPSFFLGLAVGGRVRLSPSMVSPFATSGPRVRGHSRFSPAAFGPRAGHLSVQHFTLHQPEQGRRGLSFVVEGAAASRPSRHPISGMSSFARYSASSIAFHSRMGASTGGIAWVLRTIRSGYTLQFGRNPPRFDGVQLTVVNSASKASVLQQELSSLLQKGAIEEIPQSDIERGFFSHYFLVPKRDGGLRPILDLRRLNFSLYKKKFKILMMKTIMSQIQGGDWFVTIDLCVFPHPGRSATQEVLSVCLWREGLPIQGPALRPGLGAENVHEMHGCCTGPI